MSTMTYSSIRVTGPFPFQSIRDVSFHTEPGVHAEAKIRCILSEEMASSCLDASLKNQVVTLSDEEGGNIFTGILIDSLLEEENGYFELTVFLKSGSYLLDQKKKSRSFQDTSMTYKEVINQVLADTDKAAFVMLEDYTRTIEKPLIQFLETDWEFCLRLATHFNSSLYPELTRGEPKFYFGMPEPSGSPDFSENYYRSFVSKKFYAQGGVEGGRSRTSYQCYEVEDYENHAVGTKVNYLGKSMLIAAKEAFFSKGILVFSYLLATKEYLYEKKRYNEKISGMSILGTVLETDKEQLKLHLDIDETQDKATAYFYDWVPTTGNLMYLMPQVGTRVSLYFYNMDERSAHAVNCVRTNGKEACSDMQDFNNRFLTTEHRKRLYLQPENMGLVGTSDTETPLHILVDDNEGIVMQSHKKMKIIALDGISIESPQVVFQCQTELLATHATIELSGDGSDNYPYAVMASPIATIDMFNRMDIEGNVTRYACWIYVTYDPFDDAPQDGHFDWLGFIGNIAVGVIAAIAITAVVFVVVSATLATGGATLAVTAAALSTVGITMSTTMLTTVLASIAASVAGALVLNRTLEQAQDEWETGNVKDFAESTWDTINYTVTVGSAIISTVEGIEFICAAGLAAKGWYDNNFNSSSTTNYVDGDKGNNQISINEKGTEKTNPDSTGTVWDNITPTAEEIPGTKIPATFQLDLESDINYVNPQTGQNQLWVNSNATKHMPERYSNITPTTPVSQQAQLTSFSDSVNVALRDVGTKPAGKYFGVYGCWELGINTETGVIYHALYKGE